METNAKATLPEFVVDSLPPSGHYSSDSQYWITCPAWEWRLHDDGKWIAVGGLGVDGISWSLRQGCAGIFAHYPIDDEFVWIANDAHDLLQRWEEGSIRL